MQACDSVIYGIGCLLRLVRLVREDPGETVVLLAVPGRSRRELDRLAPYSGLRGLRENGVVTPPLRDDHY
jgi:hypothetical protein